MQKQSKHKTVSIYLKEDDVPALDALCKAQGVSRNEFITALIARELSGAKEEREIEAAQTLQSAEARETFEQFLEVLPEVMAEAFEENPPIKVEVDTTHLNRLTAELRDVAVQLKKLVQTMPKASAGTVASHTPLPQGLPGVPPSGIR